ncbi:MAG: hypothetical protein MUC63_09020 [Planctomycetes bacterium]|nr:hypothetical protein [Planctomycetota bacterium]
MKPPPFPPRGTPSPRRAPPVPIPESPPPPAPHPEPAGPETKAPTTASHPKEGDRGKQAGTGEGAPAERPAGPPAEAEAPKDSSAPLEKDPAEARAREETARALDTRWHLRRRAWKLGEFLGFAEAFLSKNRETHECGYVRFEVDPDAQDAVDAQVLVELERVPLREAVEQICRQLRLRYAVVEEAQTVRLTRKGEGRDPSPPLPTPAPRRRKEPAWKDPPHRPTSAEANELARLAFQAEDALSRELTLHETERTIQRIGQIRTRESLVVLRNLTKKIRNDPTRSANIAKAMAEVDGGDAALFIMEMVGTQLFKDYRKDVLSALESLRTKEAAEAIGRAGLEHGDMEVRLASARYLGRLAWEGSIEALRAAATSSRCRETRAESTRAIAAFSSPAAVEALCELAGNADPGTAAVALEGLSRSPADRASLLKIARAAVDRRGGEEPVIMALFILGREGDAESVERAVRLLKGPTWRLKVSAARALADLRHEDGAAPLVDCLAREEGRVAYEASEALFRLTGNDFGVDADLWKRWWADHREAFFPPPVLRPIRAHALTAAPAHYHSLPVASKRIAFLLDVSASMSASLTLTHSVPGAKAAGTRLEVCVGELSRVVDALAADVSFNLIVFESAVRRWNDGIVPALPANKVQARRFLQEQASTGTTDLLEALRQAFEDPDVDTLFILSDGDPDDPAEEVLRWVRERNRTRLLAIHTIRVGGSSSFLRRLAVENGGRWVEVK